MLYYYLRTLKFEYLYTNLNFDFNWSSLQSIEIKYVDNIDSSYKKLSSGKGVFRSVSYFNTHK